ncbi:cytochrome P450 [Crepidotus variabilis]|uniref:Cytochrome P450 n=1 Tax=Crepidotus variabilis TaxID=179855 RepID=A0A9P6E7X0_9AGAR|nr:cytochrome P450 [Crepidotus variabilis]
MIVILGATLVFVFLIRKVVRYGNIIRGIGNAPGRRSLFSPDSFLGGVIPRTTGITLGRNYAFVDKHIAFARLGYDIETTVTLLPKPRADIFVADASLVKEITSSRSKFPKPLEQYTLLGFFGPNIVVSEAHEWKKYRKISAPAFSERNNKLVWEVTIKIMDSLFDDVWAEKKSIVIEHGVNLTLPLALFVIGVAGFGQNMSWSDDETVPFGRKMTFKQALHITTAEFVPKLFLPEWSLSLTEKTRRCRDGFSELRQYMKEMVHERLAAGSLEDRHDLFSSLLSANGNEEISLDEDEILGNIYIFLLAGHETTAHTLCYALALLALYEEEQEALHAHICALAPHGQAPPYEDMPKFTRVLAVMYETLRLFPSVTTIPKSAAEDTQLTTVNAEGKRLTIPVPRGTHITIHTAGLHFNPRYWTDPHKFMPERFLKSWNKDAFLPFSGGARACIGRKFSETEFTAAIVKLLLKYQVTIKDEPEFATEIFEQKKERVLKSTQFITTSPVRVPLVFTLRS